MTPYNDSHHSSSSEANVGSDFGQPSSSTPSNRLRRCARLSSGDHFIGAAACATPPHDGQTVVRQYVPQDLHCCICWRAISFPLSLGRASCVLYYRDAGFCRFSPAVFSGLEVWCFEIYSIRWCTIIMAGNNKFRFFV